MKAWVLVFCAAAIASFAAGADESPPPPPPLAQVPAFRFTDQNGRTVSSDDLKGHVWVADFIFTRCAGPCPIMTQRMVALAKRVKDPEVRFVGFSVDPEHDSPAVLKEYAQQRGATDPRMHFLTGPKDQIFAVARTLLVAAQPGTADHPIIHSDRFLVIDKEGRLRDTFRPLEPGAMDETAKLVAALSANPLLKRFPAINASLNATAGVFLLLGYMFIRWKLVRAHAACMICAVGASAAFLACYVTYHTMKGGVVTRFPEHSIKPFYTGILLSHTILAVVILPMIVMTLVRAARRQWDRHRRISRPTFWLWLYVSVTGVVVYWMLYHLAPTLTAPAGGNDAPPAAQMVQEV
jgi:protein SCO1/2/putative membrane protein